MSRFYEIEPTAENYWRAIILFGRNSASYKFALAKALLDIQSKGKSVVSLDDLAKPYSHHLCEHLKLFPKQGISEKSIFLDSLRQYNIGEISSDLMLEQTVRHGFNHVIDAFHNLNSTTIGTRFFTSQSNAKNCICLTDELMAIAESGLIKDLYEETEARWCLVESAWKNNVSRNIMLVKYEASTKSLLGENLTRRVNITSARPALNGYQKGRCFYCFRDISISSGSDNLADVDHFFPHNLKKCDPHKPIDGVSNLVLSCQDCNRGINGKFDKLPSLELLERLYKRNEYLIISHHPLRETLISQTGNTAEKRKSFLQDAYSCSLISIGGTKRWQPKQAGPSTF